MRPTQIRIRVCIILGAANRLETISTHSTSSDMTYCAREHDSIIAASVKPQKQFYIAVLCTCRVVHLWCHNTITRNIGGNELRLAIIFCNRSWLWLCVYSWKFSRSEKLPIHFLFHFDIFFHRHPIQLSHSSRCHMKMWAAIDGTECYMAATFINTMTKSRTEKRQQRMENVRRKCIRMFSTSEKYSKPKRGQRWCRFVKLIFFRGFAIVSELMSTVSSIFVNSEDGDKTRFTSSRMCERVCVCVWFRSRCSWTKEKYENINCNAIVNHSHSCQVFIFCYVFVVNTAPAPALGKNCASIRDDKWH